MAHYVSPRDFDRILHDQDNYNSRLIWTISLSEIAPDRYALRILSGLGDIAGRVTLTYRRRPRDIRLTGYEPSSRIGTVNWSGIEASGTGTNFTNLMMGAVIRVSGDSAYHPEGLTGLHAYVDEGLIYKIANSTKLYAWSPAGGMNYSGTKYIITDYLDLSPGMYSALLSGAEVLAARLLGKNIEGSVGVYGRDLRLAFESDAVSPLSGRDYGCAGYSPYWWLYLRPGSDQGTGGGGVGGPDADGVCPIKPPLDGGDSDGPWASNVDGGNAGTIYGDWDDPYRQVAGRCHKCLSILPASWRCGGAGQCLFHNSRPVVRSRRHGGCHERGWGLLRNVLLHHRAKHRQNLYLLGQRRTSH